MDDDELRDVRDALAFISGNWGALSQKFRDAYFIKDHDGPVRFEFVDEVPDADDS